MRSSSPTRSCHRARLQVELLEDRQVLAGFQPSAVEQLMLERLNDARADPAAYGQSIGLDLANVAPSAPLAFNPVLIQSARQHSQDMNNRSYFQHNTPEGLTPGDRMKAAGYDWKSWGESIAGGTGYPGPADALKGLIIDSGVADLGHRRHLLAIDTLFKNQTEVGVGIVEKGTGTLSNYYTIDTANSADSRPFVTGVVFADRNNNGKYDLGEGLGGIAVTISGVGATTTWDSGGYSVRVNPGNYTVVASGGALTSPLSQTINVSGINARVNFISGQGNSSNFVQRLYQTVLGRAAGQGDIAYWSSMQSIYGTNAVVQGIERSGEARARLIQGWYSMYLGRGAGSGEVQYWVGAFTSGATEEQVLAVLLGSAEYRTRAAATFSNLSADQAFVASLYRQLLQRDASTGEINTFVGTYLPAIGRSGTATVFLTAQEFRGKQVQAMYASLLQRTPGASEVAYWASTPYDLTGIRSAIEASPEFFAKS